MELICKVQNYDWGKKGSESLVANLCANSNESFSIDENTTYAELWMGTHVNGPSQIKCNGETLESVIRHNPQYLGKKTASTFNNELPFLFKVLSVKKALSIQAHPTKEHAIDLHEKFPHIYKDRNHKPEIAIAVTPFEALCGFREISKIRKFFKELPELGELININIDDDTEFLKESFKAVLKCEKAKLEVILNSLLRKFEVMDSNDRTTYLAELVERLFSQFPNDNGILMVYFLNYLKLKPSEAVFLAANEPHAYLSGDCIENMACSDNVVRAGLTPKLVDVETLCSMLNYKGELASNKIFKPIIEDDFTKIFRPPVQDFAVAEIRVPASKAFTTISRGSASIFVVLKGLGKSNSVILKSGTILFLPANDSLNISDVKEELLIYQAFANID